MSKFLGRRAAIHFGEFEAHLRLRQLRRLGQPIEIQEKPFEILVTLLAKPGEIVSRDELRNRLWPDIHHGDWNHNLNICVAKLRHALSDSAGNPHYIQMLSGRGYRFIAPVEVEEEGQPKQKSARIRLAVLPLALDASKTCAEKCYFCDGLAVEISACLGHLYPDELGVIARSSTLKYRGTTKSPAQVGRELTADYLLEITCRTAADNLHVIAQLIQVKDQTYLWAENYDYDPDDLITIQRDVAERVARSLGLKLLPMRSAAHPEQGIPSAEAHLLYLKGYYYQSKATEEALEKSIACFERAVQVDSAYALAYCSLAYSYSLFGLLGFAGPPREYLLPAGEAARAAFRINDNLADPNVSLAIVKYLYEWDWAGSERLLRRALELNPSHALAHRTYSYLLSSNGRHEEAIVEARKACELDPVSLLSNVCLGAGYYLARRYGEAIACLQDILEIQPTFGLAMGWLGATYSLNSMHAEAIHVLEKARKHYSGNTQILGWLGAAYARAGRGARARKVLDELADLSTKRYVSAFDVALIYAGLEQTDQTFEWLAKAFEERCPFFWVLLPVDPRLDALRSDPRYHALADRIRKAHYRNRAPSADSLSPSTA